MFKAPGAGNAPLGKLPPATVVDRPTSDGEIVGDAALSVPFTGPSLQAPMLDWRRVDLGTGETRQVTLTVAADIVTFMFPAALAASGVSIGFQAAVYPVTVRQWLNLPCPPSRTFTLSNNTGGAYTVYYLAVRGVADYTFAAGVLA